MEKEGREQLIGSVNKETGTRMLEDSRRELKNQWAPLALSPL